jgi:hypothetical protein
MKFIKRKKNVIFVDFKQNRGMTLKESKAFFNDGGQFEWAMEDASIYELEELVDDTFDFDFKLCEAYFVILQVRKNELLDPDNVIPFKRHRKNKKKVA